MKGCALLLPVFFLVFYLFIFKIPFHIWNIAHFFVGVIYHPRSPTCSHLLQLGMSWGVFLHCSQRAHLWSRWPFLFCDWLSPFMVTLAISVLWLVVPIWSCDPGWGKMAVAVPTIKNPWPSSNSTTPLCCTWRRWPSSWPWCASSERRASSAKVSAPARDWLGRRGWSVLIG